MLAPGLLHTTPTSPAHASILTQHWQEIFQAQVDGVGCNSKHEGPQVVPQAMPVCQAGTLQHTARISQAIEASRIQNNKGAIVEGQRMRVGFVAATARSWAWLHLQPLKMPRIP